MARFENLNVGKLNAESVQIGGGTLAQVAKLPMLLEASHTVVADGTVTLVIPANTLVLSVYVEVVTAAGETCTATVGDGDAADGWIADAGTIDLNATAGTRYKTLAADDGYEGKLYSSADTIDVAVTLDGGTGSVAFKIQALVVKM
jgi:hypothetical protein